MSNPLADAMYDHDDLQGQARARQEQDEANQQQPTYYNVAGTRGSMTPSSTELQKQITNMLESQGHGDLIARVRGVYDDSQELSRAIDEYFKSQGLQKIRIGSAEALVKIDEKKLTVISLLNEQPGNGDFQKLMDDLEGRGKPVVIEELWNKDLRQHLIERPSYRPTRKNGNKRLIYKGVNQKKLGLGIDPKGEVL